MATFEHDGATIHYEEHGTGFPVLLIAPGGMRSAIPLWDNAPWNPITELSNRYRVIAMDQRNAGASSGPVRPDDGWDTYTGDQLALLDHLGIDEFAVLGMCIGGAYIMNLIRHAPDRVVAGVMLQPIGLEDNRDAFNDMFDAWAEAIRGDHPDMTDDDWAAFRAHMYGGDAELFTATASDVAKVETPLLVLMGDDHYHPASASRLVAEAAPNATLIEEWKEGDARGDAMAAVDGFLAAQAA
ncbi:MAG: alpha/beta fold hydrolase [Acidimicrobiales bacterium]